MISLLDPRVWLVALVLMVFSAIVGADIGGKIEIAKQGAAIVKTITVARTVEVAAAVDVNAVATKYEARLSTQKEKSDHEITILKIKLAQMPATCTVPDDVVRLLDPGTVDVPADPTTGHQPGSSPTPPVFTCAAELEIAARNYREVCEPNADQLVGVQGAYNALRKRFNSQPE